MADLRDLKIDENGDLVIGDNGDIATVSGYDEVAQNVWTILNTQLGDSDLAEELGTNFENLFDKDFNEQFAQQDISDAITEQEPRVTSVDDIDFELDSETRVLTVSLSLQVDLTETGDADEYDMEVDLNALN